MHSGIRTCDTLRVFFAKIFGKWSLVAFLWNKGDVSILLVRYFVEGFIDISHLFTFFTCHDEVEAFAVIEALDGLEVATLVQKRNFWNTVSLTYLFNNTPLLSDLVDKGDRSSNVGFDVLRKLALVAQDFVAINTSSNKREGFFFVPDLDLYLSFHPSFPRVFHIYEIAFQTPQKVSSQWQFLLT